MFIYPRVRDLREDNDWTQENIAKMLGEHLTTYRRWETDEREIPAHIIKELYTKFTMFPRIIFSVLRIHRKVYRK